MQSIALSIIIPYYRESPQELFPILASLNGQLGVDFHKIESILVCDGGEDLPAEFLALFQNIRPRAIRLSNNSGPGIARQAGIDAAAGRYVMCCDADDSLANMFAFNAFIDEIEKNAPELILSSWLEEHYDNMTGKYDYAQHDVDFTWMHGKALSRAFLQKYNIRFHETLRIHEDNYFLALVYAAAEDMRKIPAMTYVWKHHPNSITRSRDGAYLLETMPSFIESTRYILKEMEKRHPNLLQRYVAQAVINVYFILQKRRWHAPENAPALAAAEAAFSTMISPFLSHFHSVPPSVLAAMYSQERDQSFKAEIEVERLDAWVSRVCG